MNSAWSVFSKYIQAITFAVVGFFIALNFFNPWCTSLITAVESFAGKLDSILMFILRAPLFPLYFLGPIPAIAISYCYAQASFLVSLEVHRDIFDFFTSRVSETNHELMAKLAITCAFWTGVRVIVTGITAVIFFHFLKRHSDLAAVTVPLIAYFGAGTLTCEIYKNFVKQLYVT